MPSRTARRKVAARCSHPISLPPASCCCARDSSKAAPHANRPRPYQPRSTYNTQKTRPISWCDCLYLVQGCVRVLSALP
eukprot:1214136-Prymnesium_polylepis.1